MLPKDITESGADKTLPLIKRDFLKPGTSIATNNQQLTTNNTADCCNGRFLS